jgi:hypothetical protein
LKAVEHNNNSQQKQKSLPTKLQRKLNAEDWVLLTGAAGFFAFLCIVAFFLIPLLSGRPSPVALPPAIVEMAATQGFVLPPTWTPGPTPKFNPTAMGTQVYDGTVPTRVYTPRATSLPGLPPLPMPVIVRRNDINVIDLARIMQGESPGDKEAAYYVGWVAKNRLMHDSYGDSIAIVSSGFFGYRASIQPSDEFLQIAVRVMRDRRDPTEGSLYALSRTDITNLGIPPQRADITKGEWFFFKTWPLSGR